MPYASNLGQPVTTEIVAIASGTSTAALVTSATFINENGWKGVKAILGIGTLVSTNLTLSILEADANGRTVALLASAALTASGEITVHPQVATVANKTLSNVAPARILVTVAPNAGGSNDVYGVTLNWLP